MKTLIALSLAFGLAAAAHAAGGPPHRGFHGGPPMDRSLFPPDLLLSNQIALGLTDDQTAAIKKGINETHQRVLDIHTSLQRVTEQLHGELEAAKINEASALALASQAMDLEKQIKTAHMTLLIRTKNLLTAEQIEKAEKLRPPDAGERGMMRHGPAGGAPQPF